MESERLGIGEVARASGLPVSALRFYDGAGVLVPAVVDRGTGYRRYDREQVAEARLVAVLRRVGMPLADIRLALAGRAGGDPTLPVRLLAAHVRRLERGVAEARSELSRLRGTVEKNEHTGKKENAMTTSESRVVTLTLAGAELAAALDAVRFAVGHDPELPALAGVLFDVEDGTLRLVATDRYRLAVAGVPLSARGDRARALVATPVVDAMRALLTGAAWPARLTVRPVDVALEVGGRVASGPAVDETYPDYRRLVGGAAGRRVVVDAAALRAEVAAGPVREERRGTDGARRAVSVLTLTADGALRPGEGEGQRVAVDREFLTEALAALASDRAEVEIAGPSAPLTFRPESTGPGGGRAERMSLLMPVALEGLD
ncbi:DNA polymerase III subunit beta family protein [Streptomyces triticirhizae]|uniref:MerR family transcriptional regulator n=1 Tax=Streptomyces triticirhizae TaxID=2483353 RepID=A0A3M2MAC8_9ACTN|nr:MerR family transcriptional regulator [Streptomyces triticirhizae]RMI46442.1 MerR family transcriptional regulator [Streptomyces triticirhizae]